MFQRKLDIMCHSVGHWLSQSGKRCGSTFLIISHKMHTRDIIKPSYPNLTISISSIIAHKLRCFREKSKRTSSCLKKTRPVLGLFLPCGCFRPVYSTSDYIQRQRSVTIICRMIRWMTTFTWKEAHMKGTRQASVNTFCKDEPPED